MWFRLLFAPYKRHANKFNYLPRYYDPEKEAREQRRAELRGTRSDDAEGEYVPGQYLRTQREARAERRSQRRSKESTSLWVVIGAVALLFVFAYMLYPRIASMLAGSQRSTPATEYPAMQGANGTLDQSGISEIEWQTQEITIVPNDYVDE